MIIKPEENTRQLISPFEEPETQAKPSMSILEQGKTVVQNNITDEVVREQQLATLEKQNIAQIKQSAHVINQQKETERVNQLLQSDTDSTVVANALQTLAQKRVSNKIALEEEYLQVMSSKSRVSPVQRYLQENDKDFFERLSDTAKKELAISNKIDELRSASDGMDVGLNLLGEITLVNFLQRSLGLGVLDYGDELRSLQTRLEEATAEEAVEIMEENEELIKATQFLGDNPEYVAGELQSAFSSRTSQRTDALLNFFDFADTLLIGKDFLKVGNSLVKASSSTKAAITAGATDDLAERIVKGDIDAVEGTSLGGGLRQELNGTEGISAKVIREAEVNERILRDAVNNFSGMSYEEVQALDVFESIRDRIKNEFSNGTISEVAYRQDGVAEVTLMKANGNGYVSEASAKGALSKKKLKGSVYQLDSGAWAIKAEVDAVDAKVANLSTQGVTWLTRQLRRPESWVEDDLLVYGQISENALNQITKAGQSVSDNTLGKLNKTQTKEMLPVLELQIKKGEADGKWMTAEEIDVAYRQLYDRPVSERELDAFNGYRLLNDFHWELDNKTLYEKKKAQGFGTVPKDLFNLEVNGKMVEDFPKNDYIFFQDSGTVVNKQNSPEDFLNRYDVIEVDDVSAFTRDKGYGQLMDTPTPYIAVPKGKVTLEPLNPKQLAYLAGGRKRYDDSTIFLKQSNVGKYENGNSYRKPDSTLFVASSMPQAKREADSINALNAILRKGVDDLEVRKQADDFLQNRLVLGVDNVDEYLARAKARGLDINKDIVPLRNREMIRGEELPSEFIGDMDFQQVANGRLSARGFQEVPHIDPESTQLLNPIAAINQNFAAASNNAAFGAYRDYTLSYLERYRKYLNVKPEDPRISLLDAEIRDASNLTSRQIQKIKGEQQFAREVVGRRTEEELAALRDIEKRVEWALDKTPDKIIWGDKDKLVGKLSGELKQDPLGKIRGLVFNAKLGLFSLPAMIIQAIHAPVIAAIAPKYGTKALMTYPVLRMALVSRDPDVVKAFAKKGWVEKLGLEGYGDLEKFFLEFRHHGFDNFGSNMVYENAARGDNLMRGWGAKFAGKGRMFFEEGELVPRMTAYATSVREWIDNAKNINPKGLPIDSKEGRKYIVQRSNTLTLGMTRADLQQGLKSGFLGLLAQFQSYPMRALDAMVFPSKTLTGKEKGRMIAAYLVMYGSAGLPFMDYFAEWAFSNADLEGSPASYKFIYNGIVDGLVMAATGEDTNFASRGGLGDWANEIVESFTDSNKSVLEVALGPAGSTASGSVDTIMEYAKAYKAGFNPDPSYLGSQAIMDVAKQVSSFNNLYRAWVAWNTGKIFDSRGNQFIEISKTANILQLFGIPPQAYADIGMLYASKDKRRQIINLNTEMMVKLHNEFASEKDPNKRQAIIDQLNVIGTYVQQDGLSQEVNSAVSRRLSQDSTYQQLKRKALMEAALGEKGAVPFEIEAKND